MTMMMTIKVVSLVASAAPEKIYSSKKKSRALPGSFAYSFATGLHAFELDIPHVVNMRTADITELIA
jgi:hypothetical protein